MYIDVEIKKPLSVNSEGIPYVAVRDLYILKAIQQKAKLRIKTPQGIGIEDPKLWKKTGKRFEQVFLRPDEPMVLYSNYVHIDKRTPEEKERDHILESLGYKHD